jgi:hypothetical protein
MEPKAAHLEHHPVTTSPLCPLCHHITSTAPLPPRRLVGVASAAFVAAAASAAASVAAVAAAASVAASVSPSSSVLCRRPLPLCPRPLPLSPPHRHFCRRSPPLSPLPPLSLIDCCIAASAWLPLYPPLPLSSVAARCLSVVASCLCRRLVATSVAARPLPPLSLIDCCIATFASRHLPASPSSTPEEDGERGQLGSGRHGHK